MSDELDDFSTFNAPTAINAEELKKQVNEFKKHMDHSQDPLVKMNQKISHEFANQEHETGQLHINHGGLDPNLSLGNELIKKGLITKDQLEIAIKEQNNSAERKELGAILVDLGFINDLSLSQFLSETSGVKSFDLKTVALDPELIKMIPKNIAVQYKVVPIQMDNDELHIATSDIYNVIAIDQIKRNFPKNIKVKTFFTNEAQITQAIDQYYEYETDMHAIIKEIETGKVAYTGQEEGYVNPTVRLVESILMHAVKMNASDIHLEPENEFIRLRYRVDGKLMEILSFHKQYWSAVLVRTKIISGMNIAETRNPQDGRITLNILGRRVDFRMSTMPTIHGENIVARILDKTKSLVSLSDLGLSPKNLALIKKILRKPEGIAIVTGPTGSGKSTTLYSLLAYINSIDLNIMTLEDPVEYQLPIIRQSQIKDDVNMNFESGIRTLMRQDPDIIFVGEVRDRETASMTIRASMTGHRVFTTLHTNDALGIVPRLNDLGMKGSLLAGNIICSIAQRLARKLCMHCKQEYAANAEECKVLGVSPETPPKLFKKVGCEQCYNSGYRGRIAIYEILDVDAELDELIFKEASKKELLECARKNGFQTLADDAVYKVLLGVTDLYEVIESVNMSERLKNANLFV